MSRLTRRYRALAVVGPLAIAAMLFVGVTASQGAHANPKAKVYKIVLANSYIGNQWRSEMENLVKAYAKHKPYNTHVKLTIVNSGTDVQAQISAVENMISQHVDAILIDPASTTALNPVVEKAVHSGIVVVNFDQSLTAKDAYKVTPNWIQFGKLGAEYVAKAMHGKGNLLVNRGIPGFGVEKLIWKGQSEVFKKYPGIKIVDEVWGKWDNTVSQSVITQALASHPSVDGVANQYGAYGALEAFLKTHRKLVPMSGDDGNGWRSAMLKYKNQGLKAISVGDPPALGAYALKIAYEILQGKKFPKNVPVKIPTVTTGQLKPGVNVFPNAPASLIDTWNIPGANLGLTEKNALG